MAINSTTESKCFQVVQQSLINLAGAASPGELMPAIGMLDALGSPANIGGLQALNFEALQGKDRPQNSSGKPILEIKVKSPSCDYETTGSPDICTAGSADANPYLYFNATIDKQYWRKFTITNAQFANLNETPDERIALRIADAANEILIEINNDMIAKAAAHLGAYADGTSSITSPRPLNVINSNGNYQPLALASVAVEYKRGGYVGKPIGVGGAKVDYASFSAALNGTGTFTSPQNVAAPVTLFADYNIDTVMNNSQENLITWRPGTLRLLEWFQNVGYNKIDLDNQKAYTVNVMGAVFDIDFVWDCSKAWVVTVSKWADLFYPTDAMYASCYKSGLLGWELACGAADCTLAS